MKSSQTITINDILVISTLYIPCLRRGGLC